MFFPFVILHHTRMGSLTRTDHWDWLLDWPGRALAVASPGDNPVGPDSCLGLMSFALRDLPAEGRRDELLLRLPPHRPDYLEYEGPISGDRGSVRRVASGHVNWIRIDPYRLDFQIAAMEFVEASSTPWPSAAYCLAHVGDVDSAREPWFSPQSDAQPWWQLQRSL